MKTSALQIKHPRTACRLEAPLLLNGDHLSVPEFKRASAKSSFVTWLAREEMPGAREAFKKADIQFVETKSDSEWPNIRLQVDQNSIRENAKLFEDLAKLMKNSHG